MKLTAMFHVKPRAEKRLVTTEELSDLRWLAEVAHGRKNTEQAARLEEEHRRAVEDSGEITRVQ